MSHFPRSVTLIGKEATNPALPQDNLSGILSIENGNLKFESSNYIYQIPLEHIAKLTAETEQSGLWLRWLLGGLYIVGVITLFPYSPGLFFHDPLSMFIGFCLYFLPISFMFSEWSHIEVMIYITAWNEEYGMDTFTKFSIGRSVKDRKTVREIVKEMWTTRGNDRNERNAHAQVIYRN